MASITSYNSGSAGTTGDLRFKIAGTERMRIDYVGKVGIGLTPSTVDPLTGVAAGALQVNGNIELRYGGNTTDPDGARYFNIVNTDTTLVADQPLGGIQWVGLDDTNPNSNMASITSYNSGNLGTTGDLRFKIAGTERMRITYTGNLAVDTDVLLVDSVNNRVGINKLVPSVALDVVGEANFTGNVTIDNTSPHILFSETDTTDVNGRIRLAIGDMIFETMTDAGAQVRENMRIESNGNVGIDGTTFNVDATNNRVGIGKTSPSVALDVVGSVASTESILSSGLGGIGYATGAGIAVTQATSRTTTTPTTGADPCGAITVFTAAPVVGTYFSFTVPNTGIAITDSVILTVRGGSNTYVANCTSISAGTSFRVTMVSVAGTASDTPIVNFTIIKGVSA
jgi:hypothetical protein